MKKCYCIVMLVFLTSYAFCQHEGGHEHEQDHEHEIAKSHWLVLVMGNSLVTNNITERSSGVLVVPTFGLNYHYWPTNKWGFGVNSDLHLQQFKIERHGDKTELIRENPLAVCAVALYKPHPRWAILGGYGVELEVNESINLYRFGVEYGIELPKSWELAFTLEYDHKIKAYSSIMFGVAFGKGFFKK